jgi:hypothetical protein
MLLAQYHKKAHADDRVIQAQGIENMQLERRGSNIWKKKEEDMLAQPPRVDHARWVSESGAGSS